MRIHAHWTRATIRAPALPVTVGLVALLLLAPTAMPPSRATLVGGPPTGISASVTWDGTNVKSANQPSSALSVAFSRPVDVRYAWNSTGPGGASPSKLNISTARLQMFYLGVPLTTRDEVDTNPRAATNGTFDLIWDPGVLRWLLEGSYTFTASLLASNGTTMWSESFDLHVDAPYSIEALLPIVLLLIVVYEVYALVISGQQARSNRVSPRSAGPTGSVLPSTSEEGDEPGAETEETP